MYRLSLRAHVCVFARLATANMEVSMSAASVEKRRLFCVQNSAYESRNGDLRGEVIRENCITRTSTLCLLFTLFHLLTFSANNHSQARQSSICLIISNSERERERGRASRRKEQFLIERIRLLALEHEDSGGNTWYFWLSNAQVFKIIR